MNNEIKREKYEKSIKRLRISVLVVTLLSAADIVLCAAMPLTGLPFTAYTPHLLMSLSYDMKDEATGAVNFIAGIIMASIVVLAYLILFFMMRKKQRRTISALIFFTIDTIATIYGTFFLFKKGLFSPFIFDLSFHVFMMYMAINGTIAFFRLKRLNKAEEAKDNG